MRCTVHISHLNSVKNQLYYYDTVLIKGLMCITVEFSFTPKRTKVREWVKKISQMRAKALTLNFN